MNWQDHIVSNPQIMQGQPCVKGTRIPVTVVLANLAAGLTAEEIVDEYPSLTLEAVRACLSYAAELAQGTRVVLAPAA